MKCQTKNLIKCIAIVFQQHQNQIQINVTQPLPQQQQPLQQQQLQQQQQASQHSLPQTVHSVNMVS